MLENSDIAAAIEIKFIHSAGPGGQNVNKVATAAQLRFDLAALPERMRARLTALAGRQVTREGVLVITAREHRSQSMNKEEAIRRLAALLNKAAAPPPKLRKATRPSRRAVEKRLEDKKRRSRLKTKRTTLE